MSENKDNGNSALFACFAVALVAVTLILIVAALSSPARAISLVPCAFFAIGAYEIIRIFQTPIDPDSPL